MELESGAKQYGFAGVQEESLGKNNRVYFRRRFHDFLLSCFLKTNAMKQQNSTRRYKYTKGK